MVHSLMVPSLLKVGFHILLLFLLFSFHVDHAMPLNRYIYSRCNSTASYNEGDAFEANLRSVLSNLTKEAPPALFANVTEGEGSDRVYGLVQCRGDVDQDTCNACISNSTGYLMNTYCPYAMDAIICYENCQLRYSNTNFFGRLNIEDSGHRHSPFTALKPEAFINQLDGLLNNLTYQATTEPSSRFMFATDKIPYNDQEAIFGLVQCTMDTSLADCSQCLTSTISQIPTTCEDKGRLSTGCEIVTGSCRVEYHMELFSRPTPTPDPYFDPPLPFTSSTTPFANSAPTSDSTPASDSPPPSDSTPSPSLSTGSSNTSSDKANHSSIISVTMITVITFALTSMFLLIVPSWL